MLGFLFSFAASSLSAQGKAGAPTWKLPFVKGEKVEYDVYFKWGLLMSRAGKALFTLDSRQYDGQSAWRYRLLFHTTGLIDKFFSMKDTLSTFFSPEGHILFSSRNADEGGYYLVDEISFSPSGEETLSHSLRYTRTDTRIDTLLRSGRCTFDMLGSVMYLRSIDWEHLVPGREFPLEVVIGRDVVNVRFRYEGQAIVAPSEKLKYRTRRFTIDVYDPAFTQSKAAAEVWIGDDANHLPIRVRAKLKIGAAEVYYRSSENLAHPLDCRVEIP
jgi:hypothetical protein